MSVPPLRSPQLGPHKSPSPQRTPTATPPLEGGSIPSSPLPTAAAPQPSKSITWRHDDALVIGRYLFVFRPVMDSLINTIFWGEGHKTIAHLLLFTYMTWYGLCGVRFIMLLTAFHIFLTATSHKECSDEEALRFLEETMMDIAIVLKKVKPSSKMIWPVLVAFVAAEVGLQQQYQTSLWQLLDDCIGVGAIAVLLFGRTVVRPGMRNAQFHNVRVSAPKPKHKRVPSSFTAPTPGGSPLTSPRSPFVREDSSTTSTRARSFSQASNNSSGTGTIAAATSTPKSPSTSLLPSEPAPTVDFDKGVVQQEGTNDATHLLLTLATQPGWSQWKSSDNITCETLAVPWVAIKAGRTFSTINQPIDRCVEVLDDDDGVKPIDKLAIFKYDKMTKTYRRVARDDSTSTRTVQVVFRQVVFGVAPRESLFNCTSRYLTHEEVAAYGIQEAKNGGSGDSSKRVFILAMTSAVGPKAPSGTERVKMYRHGIILRELADNTTRIELCSSMHLGGKLPEWIVDIGRGETMKLIHAMKGEIERVVKEDKKRGK